MVIKEAARILFVDLKAEYESLRTEVNQAIQRVLESGNFILGQEVASFEKEFSSYLGTEYAVGVLSGVQLQLADVNPSNLNLSIDSIKNAIRPNTRAIVVVHLYGNPAVVDEISEFAKGKGIYLVEDCAQAAGADFGQKKLGTFGDISCFSFYPTKNLGACGDGGMVVTNNEGLAQRVKSLRMYGETERYKSTEIGQNSRLDEIQAAILRAKLPYLDRFNAKRKILAKLYIDLLRDMPIRVANHKRVCESVHHLFPIIVEKRDELQEFLKANDIAVGVHYPVCVHETPAFENLGYANGDFPVSELASRHILSLPMQVNSTFITKY
ncbi:MAG: hypothetical protein UT38_C0010G0033 [Microgenomates group bacterium GW2011_GWA2_39_19]|nr:MAG: hypothetical protein UT38_C0010G0033 [Microgenomates group bacterium GW2011_GWA2_39_19]